jgi:hypothetical protein
MTERGAWPGMFAVTVAADSTAAGLVEAALEPLARPL